MSFYNSLLTALNRVNEGSLKHFLMQWIHDQAPAEADETAAHRRWTAAEERQGPAPRPQQPELPFDPMPERIEPCLAKLVEKPPHGEEWSYELKWDGYRLAVHVEPGAVRIITRNGHDWTHRFPVIEAAARAFMPGTMILDGEAVVLNEQGIPDFGRLQNSLGTSGCGPGKRPAGDAILYPFDVLPLNWTVYG